MAEALGISRRQIYRLVESGELGSTRIGRALVVPADALREYVERLNAAAAARE